MAVCSCAVLCLSVSLCMLQAEAGEIEVLRVQLGRVQAEKNDLVALNSELQLKMGQESPDNSFIEIRIAVRDADFSQSQSHLICIIHTPF